MAQNTINNDKIIRLTNMICCKIFEKTSFLYHRYEKFDMEEGMDQISDIFIDIKNNNITEENFNFIVSVITDLLLGLKSNIVRIENDNIYYRNLVMNYIEEIKTLNESNYAKTSQLKN